MTINENSTKNELPIYEVEEVSILQAMILLKSRHDVVGEPLMNLGEYTQPSLEWLTSPRGRAY